MKKSKLLNRTTSKKWAHLNLAGVQDGTAASAMSPRNSSGSVSSRAPRTTPPLDIPEILSSRKDVSKLKKLRIGKLLLGNPVALLAMLESTSEGDAHSMSFAITTTFGSKLQALHLILYCTYRELDCTPNPELILRGGGLYTRVLSMLASKASKEYLNTVLLGEMQRVASDDIPLEIDPAKLDDEAQLSQNTTNITRVCKTIIKALTNAVEQLPEIVVLICKELYNVVREKFPGHEGHAISGFLILRLLCPALTQPEHYELLSQCPTPLRRKFILVAKVLQAIFNETLERKEDWMQPMTAFIKSNQKARKVLVKKILARKELTGTDLVKYLALSPDAKKEEHKKSESFFKEYSALYGRDIFPFVDITSVASTTRVGSLEKALRRESALLGHDFQGIQEAWVTSAREWCFVQIFSATKRVPAEEQLTSSAESRTPRKRLHHRVRSLGDIFDMGKDAIGAKVDAALPTKSTSQVASGRGGVSPSSQEAVSDPHLPSKLTRTGSVPSTAAAGGRRLQPYKEPRVEYYQFTLHHVFDLPHEFSVRKGSTHYKRLRSVASKHLKRQVDDLLVEVDGEQVPLTQDLLEQLLCDDSCERLDLYVSTREKPSDS